MRIYVFTVAFAVLVAFLSVVLWGAIGQELTAFHGSLVLSGVLLIGGFSLASWRSRWAGARGASLRGWIAMLVLALIMTATPFFAARDLTSNSLVNHGGWWTQDVGVLAPMRDGLHALGALVGESGETPSDAQILAITDGSADGSGTTPEGDSGTPEGGLAEGSGEMPEGDSGTPEGDLADGSGAPPEGDSGTPEGDLAEGSGGTPEGRFEVPGGTPVEGFSLTPEGDSGTPEGRFDALQAAAVEEPPERGLMVPQVDAVVVRGRIVWPSEDTPHPLALTLDATSLESLRDGVCELRGTERLRVAHDWIALNIQVTPDERNAAELPTPEERRERARVAFDWRAGTSEAIAALFVELSCGARTLMVRGGDAEFHREGGNASYWNAVELGEAWLIVDAAQDAGCVPSPDCDTPYRATHFLAPPQASIRERIPSPGSFVPYGGDVDITALLDGPSLGPDFFAAGLALDRMSAGPAFEFAVVNPAEHNIRAVVWDSSAAVSVNCRRVDSGTATTFSCPAVGASGGRVRLLGQATDAWTWQELAAWTL